MYKGNQHGFARVWLLFLLNILYGKGDHRMHFNKQTKQAVNFFIFSYFGITMKCEKIAGIDEINGMEVSTEEIIYAAIQRSYRDATQQRAFNALIPKEKRDAEKFDEIKKEGGISIKKQIEKLLNEPCVNEFDDWHKEICKELIDWFKTETESEAFSYGNAQKWVNMTLKYLYIIYQIFAVFEPENDFVIKYGKLIDQYSVKFHVPVDSYIIDKSWSFPDIILPLKENAKREKVYKHPHEYVKPWSQWNVEEYTEYRKSLAEVLGENVSPIEWENQAWIEAVKARKA